MVTYKEKHKFQPKDFWHAGIRTTQDPQILNIDPGADANLRYNVFSVFTIGSPSDLGVHLPTLVVHKGDMLLQ